MAAAGTSSQCQVVTGMRAAAINRRRRSSRRAGHVVIPVKDATGLFICRLSPTYSRSPVVRWVTRWGVVGHIHCIAVEVGDSGPNLINTGVCSSGRGCFKVLVCPPGDRHSRVGIGPQGRSTDVVHGCGRRSGEGYV